MSLNKTQIEWALNPDGTPGYTANPVRGECPMDCSYCYVKPLRKRYGWHSDIRYYPEVLEAICARRKPAGIFLGSTIELFHDKTIQYMPEIIRTIEDSRQHRFYLLTKQPQNLIKFSPFPDNCWVGVTATNNQAFIDACGYLGFLKHKGEIKTAFISIEPLLSWDSTPGFTQPWLQHGGINQVIIGAQSRPTVYPKIEWVKEIVEAADKAGVAVFLKDNLFKLFMTVPHSDLFWEDMSHLRQELPI
ncbi:hypothetical protein LCGC14_1606590 [marine sediment metagenome]|uniref:Radical SAM core domain-containing protein n=1 Tax=marine sediment metagenome TaxID=412755 RepID=A0A0F9I9Y2_9ZZZZ